MMNGSATSLNAANPATAMMRKIHLISLPFHEADFILNEKNLRLQTIMKLKTNVMPRQAQ